MSDSMFVVHRRCFDSGGDGSHTDLYGLDLTLRLNVSKLLSYFTI